MGVHVVHVLHQVVHAAAPGAVEIAVVVVWMAAPGPAIKGEYFPNVGSYVCSFDHITYYKANMMRFGGTLDPRFDSINDQ